MLQVRYPEIPASVPGGFEVDDPQQGVGALSTVIAWIDGRPVGCSTLRAAREGYPAGSGELKKVWVEDDARGAGAARALNNGAPNIERADKLVQAIAAQTGLRNPVIDATVALVDARLEANRKKAAA